MFNLHFQLLMRKDVNLSQRKMTDDKRDYQLLKKAVSSTNWKKSGFDMETEQKVI